MLMARDGYLNVLSSTSIPIYQLSSHSKRYLFTMTQSPATSLASHLISQIRSNLSLLEQLSIIQPQDADQIRTKLPPPNGPFPSLDVAAGHNSGNGAPGVSGNAVIPSVSISSPHSPGHTQAQGQAQAQGQGGIEQGMARMGLNHQQQQVSTPTQVQSAVMAPPALPSRGSVENRAKAIWDYTGNVSRLAAFVRTTYVERKADGVGSG